MNFKEVHPVRALLALMAWLAVLFMMVTGAEVPAAGWTLVGVITTFYFATT